MHQRAEGQAKLVLGGPVQVYASGFRNPYDVLIAKTAGKVGKMYTSDNAGNSGWGGYPKNEAMLSGGGASLATNEYVAGEPGTVNNKDGLHFITGAGFSEAAGGGSGIDAGLHKLGQYNRSATGARGHYQQGDVSGNAFAIYDSLRQVVEEYQANGTSGPFAVRSSSAIQNSDKVELVVRDKNQTNLIKQVMVLQRYVDYTFEPLSGRILFNQAIASLSADGDPQSVRITYEVDRGGERFWVLGADAGGEGQVLGAGQRSQADVAAVGIERDRGRGQRRGRQAQRHPGPAVGAFHDVFQASCRAPASRAPAAAWNPTTSIVTAGMTDRIIACGCNSL